MGGPLLLSIMAAAALESVSVRTKGSVEILPHAELSWSSATALVVSADPEPDVPGLRVDMGGIEDGAVRVRGFTELDRATITDGSQASLLGVTTEGDAVSLMISGVSTATSNRVAVGGIGVVIFLYN